MRILISGANGYIGSKLTQELNSAGYALHALVRSDNAIIRALNIPFQTVDIIQPITWIPDMPFELFIHLAAANDIDSASAEKALAVSALGTRHCLDFCVKNKIPKFIYFSTFQVYGNVDGHFSENTSRLPVNDYGLTHFFAEEYVKMAGRKKQVDFLILRPTNIYGAPLFKEIDRWSLVPGCFCIEAIEKNSITLLSSGKQVRDFLDLNDLASYVRTLIQQMPVFGNKEINVSSGNFFSILEIAQMVKEVYEARYKKELQLLVKSDQPALANTFAIDRTEVLKSAFNFSGKKSILDEISRTFDLLD